MLPVACRLSLRVQYTSSRGFSAAVAGEECLRGRSCPRPIARLLRTWSRTKVAGQSATRSELWVLLIAAIRTHPRRRIFSRAQTVTVEHPRGSDVAHIKVSQGRDTVENKFEAGTGSPEVLLIPGYVFWTVSQGKRDSRQIINLGQATFSEPTKSCFPATESSIFADDSTCVAHGRLPVLLTNQGTECEYLVCLTFQ